MEEKSYKEIAQELGVPVADVNNWLARGRSNIEDSDAWRWRTLRVIAMLRVNLGDYPGMSSNLGKLSSYKTEALRCNPKSMAWVEEATAITPDNHLYHALPRQ